MLVLSRKLNEQIVLNPGTANEIVIEVVDLQRGKVRIGITAPETVRIMRRELLTGDPNNESS